MNCLKGKYIRVLLLSIPFLISCSNDKDSIEPNHSSDNLIIGANINGSLISRSYQEEGSINEGEYRITYRDIVTTEFVVGSVSFVEGTGFGKKAGDDSKELKWSDISPEVIGGSKYNFFLDNLIDQEKTTTVVTNYETLKPFVAAEFDSINGSNDLLWGQLIEVEGQNPISFDLYHVMSRFSLKVYLDNSNPGYQISPVSAFISNVFTTPLSFDRMTGTLEHDENLVDKFILVKNNEGWKSGIEADTLSYYCSPDYIIPPQQFVSDNRPRLTVTTISQNGDEESYSGLLPTVMYHVDEYGQQTLLPMQFLRGYKLILNVKVNNDGLNLQFLPVTVLDWIDKGTFTLQGGQASVKDADDLKLLISAYNASKTDEFYKWGYYNVTENKWIFNIFRDISISADDFKEAMPAKDDLPYAFNLYNNTVVVELGNEKVANLSGESGAVELYDLLNGGIIPEATIDDNEDSGDDNVADEND